MRLVTARRALASLALVVVLGDLAVAGCSSDTPPSAGFGGGDAGPSMAGDGRAQTVDADGDDATSTSDASSADESELPNVTDAEAPSDAPFEAEPDFQCLGDAAAPDAESLPTSCPSSPCSARCTKIAASYRLGIAQSAVACIAGLASCDHYDARNCVGAVLERVCIDDSYQTTCTDLMTACAPTLDDPEKSAAIDSCMDILSALSNDGRAAWTSCIQQKTMAGTCATESSLCFDQTYE